MPFILLILGIGLLLVMLVSAVGLVGFAFANIMLIALALLGGLGISALLGGVSPGTTIIAAAALFILLASAKRRKLRKSRRGYDLDLTADAVPEAAAAPLPPETPLELAFAATVEHADWARSRLAVAYESCRLFLRVADRTPLDMDAGQLAIRIRKRIPEHVDECLDKCSLATASERRTILEELVFTLEKVGASADKHRSRLMQPVSDEMTVQRRHLTREDDGPLG